MEKNVSRLLWSLSVLTLKMLSSPSTDDASGVDTNENNPRKPKKMDDVWRDQSLGLGSSSSTSSGGGDTAAEGPTFNNNKTKLTLRHRSVPRMGVRMQEFLGTFSRESSLRNNPPPKPNGVFTLFGFPIPIYAPASATHTPTQANSSPAALALASGSTDPLPEEGNSLRAGLPAALGGSNSRAPISRRKRRKPSNDVCARRARRMTMNRKSAARSRERIRVDVHSHSNVLIIML